MKDRSKIGRQNQRMPREQARFSLATWRNHATSASRRARVSEQSAQTCVHGEKNLGLNTRELMSFTRGRGLLIVRMPQASLTMFAMTSCFQCTIRSLVLNAPTHLQKSLESVGFIHGLLHRSGHSALKPVPFVKPIFRDFATSLVRSGLALWACAV